MEMDEKTAVVADGNAGCALAVNFSIAFASFFCVLALLAVPTTAALSVTIVSARRHRQHISNVGI